MHPRAMISPASIVAFAAFGAAIITSGCGSSEGKKKRSKLPEDVVFLEPEQPGAEPGGGGRGPSAPGRQCASRQDADFISPQCQSCLDAKCCDELETCFDLPAGDDGAYDCTNYALCIDDCTTISRKSSRDACYADCGDDSAKGVSDAYVDIEQCAVDHCMAACTG